MAERIARHDSNHLGEVAKRTAEVSLHLECPAATEVASGLFRIYLYGSAEVRDGPVRWQTTSQGVVLQFDASVDVAQRFSWSESHGFVVIGDRLGVQSPACPCVGARPTIQRVAWFELNC